MSCVPWNKKIAQRLLASLKELWIFLWGWIPTPLGTALRLLAWRCLFQRCGSVRFHTGIHLLGCHSMTLGNNVRVGQGCFFSATDGTLDIGDYAAFSPHVHIGADHGYISIGKHVAIGPGCVLRAANHDFSRMDIPIMQQGHIYGEIHIEDDVWIGAKCVITPNVRIGSGAVVGAGAVVTRDVPPRAIVAGVPARVIRMRE